MLATRAPSRALTGNSPFWNGNEVKRAAGLHLGDGHVQRPSGCKKKEKKTEKVTLSIIPEACWLTKGPAGAKVENCVCVTYPRASPEQPLSNCRFTRGEWSWHDKLRQNNSVGRRSANLWDWDRGMCDARESSHVMNTISATCTSRIRLPAARWRRGRQLFVLFKMKMKQCNVTMSIKEVAGLFTSVKILVHTVKILFL